MKYEAESIPAQITLASTWRERASALRKTAGADAAAIAYEFAAAELEELARQHDEAPLTINEAAARTGRSTETIRKAIGARLPNVGRKNKPRVRAGDLTRVFPRRSVARQTVGSYDVGADARDLLARRGAS